MRALEHGSEIEPGELAAPGARPDAAIVVGEQLAELAHGIRYRARQDDIAVLLTVVDPVLTADAQAHASIRRELRATEGFSHRNLLPIYGYGRPGREFLVLEHDPGGTSVRAFVRQRIRRGRPLDAETAFALVAHVCNALDAVHPNAIHGYVTADTTHVSGTGRVFLSGLGFGSSLHHSRAFLRHRKAGRLPNITPEQLLDTPQRSPATDVFGVATLFIEMVTGLALQQAGQSLAAIGIEGPAPLVACLERATAPSLETRPADVASFKTELAEAVRSGPLQRHGVTATPSTPPPPPREAKPARNTPQRPPPPPKPPPPAAPASRSTPAAPDPFAGLERATASIVKADSEQLARALTRSMDEPASSASSSILGLALGNYEDALGRVSTLDGKPDEQLHAHAGPSRSGRYFGSFSDRDAVVAPSVPQRVPLDPADERPLYFLVRDQAMEGPMSVSELVSRADTGQLRASDRVQDRRSGQEQPVEELQMLARLLATADERAELKKFAKTRAAVRTERAPAPIPKPPKDPRARNTALLVVGVLLAFGAIAGWLVLRS